MGMDGKWGEGEAMQCLGQGWMDEGHGKYLEVRVGKLALFL